jgi:2-hydroxychromene-2-carboxylate isomerase
MSAPIRFHFDFSSPYGYLAAQKVDALAAKYDRKVDWRPILLGVVFKQTGGAPLTMVPLKGDYSRRDMYRSARFHGIADFRMPTQFPQPTQNAARVFLWQKEKDPEQAVRVAKAIYRAFFVDDRNISDPEIVADAAASAGVDRAAARAAIDDPRIKDMLRQEVEAAVAEGVFGSPFIIVDGEPFWGLDRFEQVERWLSRGSF